MLSLSKLRLMCVMETLVHFDILSVFYQKLSKMNLDQFSTYSKFTIDMSLKCCSALHWALTCGGKVQINEGLEYAELPGWLGRREWQFI